MVTYADYTAFSNVVVPLADFPFIEARSVDILSMLCGQKWDEDSDICKKAVMYQIEFVQENGGLVDWSKGAGAVGSHSWSVGGESESFTYMKSSHKEGAKTFNGLAISPMAWQVLVSGGFLKTVKGVRVW